MTTQTIVFINALKTTTINYGDVNIHGTWITSPMLGFAANTQNFLLYFGTSIKTSVTELVGRISNFLKSCFNTEKNALLHAIWRSIKSDSKNGLGLVKQMMFHCKLHLTVLQSITWKNSLNATQDALSGS